MYKEICMQKINTLSLICPSLNLTLFNNFCPPPFYHFFGDILSRGILIGFPFPLPLPVDAAVSLDLGLALGSLLPPIIAFARSSIRDHLGIWCNSTSSSTCKNIKVMSLEDGMEASLSRYTEGQEETAQATLLLGPWWKHTHKTEDWPFSSGGYDEMYCGNK